LVTAAEFGAEEDSAAAAGVRTPVAARASREGLLVSGASAAARELGVIRRSDASARWVDGCKADPRSWSAARDDGFRGVVGCADGSAGSSSGSICDDGSVDFGVSLSASCDDPVVLVVDPVDADVFDDSEDDEPASVESANAVAGFDAIATPTPSATASAPTRPTWFAYPMVVPSPILLPSKMYKSAYLRIGKKESGETLSFAQLKPSALLEPRYQLLVRRL
jgi:hypothetical protein